MQIPYGVTDFIDIRKSKMFFLDKTAYIQKLEQSDRFLLFLRPRRFGKTLFLAILDAYYNLKYKHLFDELFKDTYIYQHKTKEANSYHILQFDFSIVDILDVEASFLHCLKLETESFIKRYKLNIPSSDNPLNTLKNILKFFKENQDKKLYILIDEYDHFANRLLFQDKAQYLNLITQKEALFKQFFSVLKGGTSGNNAPVRRMFITGVTPMTMYDVTSGFNIGKNISLKPEFNAMLGFTQEELKQTISKFNISEQLLELLTEWYDHYQFSPESKETVFNTDMVLYFISEYQDYKKIPRELIDINVRSDYSKLRSLLYTDKKLNGNFETLKDLILGKSIELTELQTDFSGLDFRDEENFKSLLFYLGLVTIKDVTLQTRLKIPNETIKRIDVGFLKDSLELENVFWLNLGKLNKLYSEFALHGNIEVFKYLANEIKNSTGLRDYIQNEQTIKAMYLAYLSLSPFFVVKSELELNKGFADIFLKPLNPYVECFGLIEFKFYHQKDKTKDLVQKLIAEAKIQLDKYSKDPMVQAFVQQNKKLVKVILVFQDYQLVEAISYF